MSNATQLESPPAVTETPSVAPTEPRSVPPTQSSTRKKLLIALAVVGLVVVGVFAARWITFALYHEETDDAYVEGNVIAISPKVAGHVVALRIGDNMSVKAGDVLIEIDDRDAKAQLERAKAALAAAEAQLKVAEETVTLTRATTSAVLTQSTSGLSAQERAVDAARNRLEQAKAAVDAADASAEQARAEVAAAEAEQVRAAADEKRVTRLFEKGDVSRQEFDRVTADARTAQARLDAARKAVLAANARATQSRADRDAAAETLKQSQSQTGEAQGRVDQAKTAPQQVAVSRSQVESARAEVERAKAELTQAELNLSYTKITAPEDGRITKRTVEQGAYVQIGQALFSIVPNRVWVLANFKETQLAHMKPGQEAEIHVDSFPDKVFRGRVDSLQAGTGSRFALLPPDNATGNFTKIVQRLPVKIVFDSESVKGYESRIAPGMSTVIAVKVK